MQGRGLEHDAVSRGGREFNRTPARLDAGFFFNFFIYFFLCQVYFFIARNSVGHKPLYLLPRIVSSFSSFYSLFPKDTF